MERITTVVAATVLAAVGSLLTANIASAHVTLDSPTPRYPTRSATENKSCPCGVGTSNRICDLPEERSDPNRARDRATTFAPGSTIIVQFRETVGHAGRYRIAFDADGADLDDFNANILLDVVDPAGDAGNEGGQMWALEVTLPDVECDNCTLQLIQVMDGNMDDPVPDPVGRSSYYQCADLTLETAAAGTDGTGTAGGTGTSGGTGVDSDAETDTGATTGGTTGATTGATSAPTPEPKPEPGTDTGAATSGDTDPGGDSGSSGGCAVASTPTRGAPTSLAFVLLLLGAAARRRSRRTLLKS